MLKTISLFSGAGVLDIGFMLAGYDIVFANDINLVAVELYNKQLLRIIRDTCNPL